MRGLHVHRAHDCAAAGATRNLDALLLGAERGAAVIADQHYDITNIVEQGPPFACIPRRAETVAAGSTVVAEYDWRGTLRVPVAAWGLSAGHVLRARICSVFVLRLGKILRQRNNDCYLPFDAAQ